MWETFSCVLLPAWNVCVYSLHFQIFWWSWDHNFAVCIRDQIFWAANCTMKTLGKSASYRVIQLGVLSAGKVKPRQLRGWARLYCESRNTIHTILEHSRFSSWHLGFALDYDHRHHSKFGTKDDRMSWMKKHKTLCSWLQLGGWFFIGSKNQRMRGVTSDSGTESATTLLEFIGDSVRASSYMQLPGWCASTWKYATMDF